jgi:hypothetical protein
VPLLLTSDGAAVALNATTALHSAEFSRRRADRRDRPSAGDDLITAGPNGRRISALVVR